MIKRKTVLVLGAGASGHLEFPSGRGLRDEICRDLQNSSSQLFLLLRECGFPVDLISGFGTTLDESGRPSVDVFLEYRPEFREVGKTAIAACLIPWERPSVLFGHGWYEYLFAQLGPSLHDDVASSQLSILTFNYDRSVDQYLFLALQNSFKLTETAAVSRMLNIPIVHLYGKLGELPHVGGSGSRPYRPSEPAKRAADAFAAKDFIKIVAEGVEGDLEFGRANQLLTNAQVIAFLGFGYLRENVRRLRIRERKGTPLLWGSAYDLRGAEQDRVREMVNTGDANQPQLVLGNQHQDVLEFLREFFVLG